MDLLGGYGSDASEDEGFHHVASTEHVHSRRADDMPSQIRPQDALDDLPAAPGSSNGRLWAKLPSPKVEVKKLVSFQLPINRDMLKNVANDSDEEEEERQRAAKRAKLAASKNKSKLMDYLPPPKNDNMLGAGLGGGAMGGMGAGPSRAKPLPRNFFGGDNEGGETEAAAAMCLPNNEAYRAGDEDDFTTGPSGRPHAVPHAGAVHPSAEHYHMQESTEQYAAGPSHQMPHGPAMHHYSSSGAGAAVQQPGGRHAAAAQQQELELPMELAGVQFKEINQTELRYVDPARKDAANSMRAALGAEYANKLRSQAGAAGSRLARSKHQIGTLFHNAKMNEIDILEGKASSMKTKAETQAKYGW